MMRQMVSFTLEEAGFDVQVCSAGQEALEVAQKKRFGMVITDLNMPRLDGVGLIQALRKLEPYKFTPILMLTTESAVEKKQAGKQAGATGWLTKPFEPTQLVAVAKKLMP